MMTYAEIENDVDEIMQLAASELQNAEIKQKLRVS